MAGITSIIFGQERAAISNVLIDASVSEEHVLESEVTEFPIERPDSGPDANNPKITDHVQVKPFEITIQGVISDSPLGILFLQNAVNLVQSVGSFLGLLDKRSISNYNKLIALQNSAIPFDVYTTLKRYNNMVIKSLRVTRTSQTGNALHFTATLRQVRFVESQTIAAQATSGLKKIAKSVKDKASAIKDKGQAAVHDAIDSVSGGAQGTLDKIIHWGTTRIGLPGL